MIEPLRSLVASGTKLWLDSIDPHDVERNRAWGATGATSNPIIIADLIETGRFEELLARLLREGLGDDDIAWRMTDQLVSEAQEVFHPVWVETLGDDGYVSFELDSLVEDPEGRLSADQRASRYLTLGNQWGLGRDNRLIKIPATEGGLAALEELVAAGINVNVTLTFSPRQYVAARDAVWRGALRRPSLDHFKSVYSIFVSRVDVYTEKHVPGLSPGTQGLVGIVNAKRIWQMNQAFWADKGLKLRQEIVFASTGTKKPEDPPWKYVEALAGSDIQTNPPGTNAKVQESGRIFTRRIDQLPGPEVLAEIDAEVDLQAMEETLMTEGVEKFASPQKKLLAMIARKRVELGPLIGG